MLVVALCFLLLTNLGVKSHLTTAITLDLKSLRDHTFLQDYDSLNIHWRKDVKGYFAYYVGDSCGSVIEAVVDSECYLGLRNIWKRRNEDITSFTYYNYQHIVAITIGKSLYEVKGILKIGNLSKPEASFYILYGDMWSVCKEEQYGSIIKINKIINEGLLTDDGKLDLQIFQPIAGVGFSLVRDNLSVKLLNDGNYKWYRIENASYGETIKAAIDDVWSQTDVGIKKIDYYVVKDGVSPVRQVRDQVDYDIRELLVLFITNTKGIFYVKYDSDKEWVSIRSSDYQHLVKEIIVTSHIMPDEGKLNLTALLQLQRSTESNGVRVDVLDKWNYKLFNVKAEHGLDKLVVISKGRELDVVKREMGGIIQEVEIYKFKKEFTVTHDGCKCRLDCVALVKLFNSRRCFTRFKDGWKWKEQAVNYYDQFCEYLENLEGDANTFDINTLTNISERDPQIRVTAEVKDAYSRYVVNVGQVIVKKIIDGTLKEKDRIIWVFGYEKCVKTLSYYSWEKSMLKLRVRVGDYQYIVGGLLLIKLNKPYDGESVHCMKDVELGRWVVVSDDVYRMVLERVVKGKLGESKNVVLICSGGKKE